MIWYVTSAVLLAPEFFAEVLLDGVFIAALYRRHWLQSVLARTATPFLWTLLFFVFAGILINRYAPEAVSIGGVICHFASRSTLY